MSAQPWFELMLLMNDVTCICQNPVKLSLSYFGVFQACVMWAHEPICQLPHGIGLSITFWVVCLRSCLE